MSVDMGGANRTHHGSATIQLRHGSASFRLVTVSMSLAAATIRHANLGILNMKGSKPSMVKLDKSGKKKNVCQHKRPFLVSGDSYNRA